MPIAVYPCKLGDLSADARILARRTNRVDRRRLGLNGAMKTQTPETRIATPADTNAVSRNTSLRTTRKYYELVFGADVAARRSTSRVASSLW